MYTFKPPKKKMFWQRFFDLWEISFGSTQPCSNCGFRVSSNCEYKHYYSWGVEFDCFAPIEYDEEGEEIESDCTTCHHLFCSSCKE